MATDRTLVGISEAARTLGVSPSYVRVLIDRGILSAQTTSGGHRRFDVDVLSREWAAFRGGTPAEADWAREYDLDGLDEYTVWEEIRDRIGPIPSNAYGILSYAVTEVVNNAIDHSGGARVQVSASMEGRDITIRVADDGIGAFQRLAEGHRLQGPAEALVELTKGKRTTDPKRHAGEGLFFTLRAADYATVSSNGYLLAASAAEGADRFASGSSRNNGTVVVVRLGLDTERSLQDVFEEFAPTDEGGVGGFTRTAPRVSLVTYSGDFISRSEAKRFAAGLEKFEDVVLDFDGISMIGQGFADELFRVWQNEHPGTRLVAVNASRGVQLMIDRTARS